MSERALQPRAEPDLTCSVRIAENALVHLLHVGTVRVQPRPGARPAAVPRGEAAATAWLRPFPILAYAVQEPGGVTLIDTGPSPGMIDAHEGGEFGSGRQLKWNITYELAPEQHICQRLRQVGISPAEVRRVVLTHLHGDHCGALHDFQRATVLVSRAEHEAALAGVYGASERHWPSWFAPHLVDFGYEALGAFGKTFSLERGRLMLLPTPGHSAGHTCVLWRAGAAGVLFGGDVAFSQRHLLRQQLVGLCHSVPRARRSMQDVLTLCRTASTIFLPAHDADARRRLLELERVGS